MPGYEPVFQDPQSGLVVSVDSSALPRAFLVDSVAVVTDDDAVIDRLRDPSFDPARVALVSGPVPPDVPLDALNGAAPDSAAASVELRRFTPDEIVWEVRTDRPRLLVASEIYYPAGWTATVGVEPVPILRTDFLLRGVPIPAGEHIVTMRYSPETRRQGTLISWIATVVAYLGTIVLVGLLWYRRGHPKGLGRVENDPDRLSRSRSRPRGVPLVVLRVGCAVPSGCVLRARTRNTQHGRADPSWTA